MRSQIERRRRKNKRERAHLHPPPHEIADRRKNEKRTRTRRPRSRTRGTNQVVEKAARANEKWRRRRPNGTPAIASESDRKATKSGANRERSKRGRHLYCRLAVTRASHGQICKYSTPFDLLSKADPCHQYRNLPTSTHRTSPAQPPLTTRFGCEK